MKALILMTWLVCMAYGSAGLAQTCNTGIASDTPSSRYVLKNDGTALDNKTGLTWMRCALGQGWTGSTCTGNTNIYTWQSALQTAEHTVFAGFQDWRLPSFKELLTLVENRCDDPALNATAFPNTAKIWFWSSSPFANNGNQAWLLDFGNGNDHFNGKGYAYAVRLVRGGQ